jgi:hypothetical protein
MGDIAVSFLVVFVGADVGALIEVGAVVAPADVKVELGAVVVGDDDVGSGIVTVTVGAIVGLEITGAKVGISVVGLGVGAGVGQSPNPRKQKASATEIKLAARRRAAALDEDKCILGTE